MFKKKRSVDQILESFHKNITDLEDLANEREQERAELLLQVNELEGEAHEAGKECGKARIIAGKLRTLVSE